MTTTPPPPRPRPCHAHLPDASGPPAPSLAPTGPPATGSGLWRVVAAELALAVGVAGAACSSGEPGDGGADREPLPGTPLFSVGITVGPDGTVYVPSITGELYAFAAADDEPTTTLAGN